MNATDYEIRQCPNCGLRYPLIAGHTFGERCPSCLGETQVVLRGSIPLPPVRQEKPEKRDNADLLILLDNIRSAWNVGSIFRTADGLGISNLYLCGITPSPEQESVAKTALGAEKTVNWKCSNNALETARKLKSEGYTLIALEQDERAKRLTEIGHLSCQKNLLIIGNEVTGVDLDILDLCDEIVHIPMRGQKRSFNVEVAFGIAAYHLLLYHNRD